MNFIFGASGFAREVDWLIHDLYRDQGTDFRTDCFVDHDPEKIGTTINEKPVISEAEFFQRYANAGNNVFIAIANAQVRSRIARAVAQAGNCRFPVLIHPSARYDQRAGKLDLGQGTIICAGSAITTDIRLGEFVHVNLNCTIGHDAVLEDFVTMSPGVSVSGNALLGAGSYYGTGAVVLPGVRVCPEAVIGAGAVVAKDVEMSGTYVGMPARKVGGR